MEEKLKNYLHQCLWVYIHPAVATHSHPRTTAEPEPEPQPELQPEPEPEPDTVTTIAHGAALYQRWLCEIENHCEWVHNLTQRLSAMDDAMSEAEQDEGTDRASKLLSIRQECTGPLLQRLAKPLVQALRKYDELGLIEPNSSDEEVDWEDSDEEAARDM